MRGSYSSMTTPFRGMGITTWRARADFTQAEQNPSGHHNGHDYVTPHHRRRKMTVKVPDLSCLCTPVRAILKARGRPPCALWDWILYGMSSRPPSRQQDCRCRIAFAVCDRAISAGNRPRAGVVSRRQAREDAKRFDDSRPAADVAARGLHSTNESRAWRAAAGGC